MSDWDTDIHPIQETILEVLDEPGSRTTDELLEQVADEAGIDNSTAKHHLGMLLVDEVVEKHPDFDGTYRIKNDPR